MWPMLIALIFTDALMVGVLMWLPVMRGSDVFFGVRVDDEFYRGAGRRILHGYWFWCALTFITTQAVAAVAVGAGGWPPAAQGLPTLILMAALFCIYTVYYRRVKPHEMVEQEHRFASSLRVRHLADYTSLPLEITVFILTLAPVAALLYFYPELPARIPVHWGFTGQPDRWADKSLGTIFITAISAVYMQGLLLLFKTGMLRTKMTLPAERTEEYAQLKEEFLGLTVRMMDWMRLPLAFLLGGIMLLTPVTTLARLAWLRLPLNLVMAASGLSLVVIGIYCVTRLFRIDRKLKETVGRVYVQRPQDAAHWYGGGLFYYNPDDPAVMVEKLTGLGYTLNLGNKMCWAYIAYLFVLPALIGFMLLKL